MSFGVGIGDIIAVSKLTSTIRSRFVNAPKQYKAIADEVRNLSIILSDIEVTIPEQGLTVQQQVDLQSITEQCQGVLLSLQASLKKYEALDKDGASSRGKTVWQKLKWDQNDIKWQQEQIASSVTLLGTFIGHLTNEATFTIKSQVDRLYQHHDEQQLQDTLNWLTSVDYGPQYSDCIHRRQKGTGQWFLDSHEFQGWSTQSKQTLFCPGNPGAGKTMLAAIVIDYLKANFSSTSQNVGFAYVFCNFRQAHEQSAVDLLLSLAKQLIQHQPSIPESVMELYNRLKIDRTRPSRDEILSILQSTALLYSKIFIVVDALDELQMSPGERSQFLLDVFSIQAASCANIFATSRFIPDIAKQFEDCTRIEIRTVDKDIEIYLDHHLSNLRPKILKQPGLQKHIKFSLINAAQGMFLLARLQLDLLADKTTVREVRRALENLPKGLDALAKTYDEAMQRIRGQSMGFRNLAQQVMEWIICAKRPLSPIELQQALAVEFGDTELAEDNLHDIEDMISVCAGLVIVDEESDIIRLVHYTTQEYFERTQMQWFPHAESKITKVCGVYLSFDDFATRVPDVDPEFESRLRKYPFCKYAAQNWHYHTDRACEEVAQLIPSFLEDKAKLRSYINLKNMCYLNSWNEEDYTGILDYDATALHVVCHFGLTGLTKKILEKGYNPNSIDWEGSTPLTLAAGNGHDAVVQRLLANSVVDPDPKDSSNKTPLYAAAAFGHDGIVKALLNNEADLEAKVKHGATPLMSAAAKGHKGVVEILLENGADVEAKSKHGTTPLMSAAAKGYKDVVEILLENGADVEAKSTYGTTPLMFAAAKGHKGVVEILSENGADIDAKDELGRRAIHHAADWGNKGVVKVLLENRADIEAKDELGRRAIHNAADWGYKRVVKLLLEYGADVDAKDEDGETALSHATQKGYDEIKEMLESHRKKLEGIKG